MTAASTEDSVDRGLLAQTVARDRAAFEALYRRHREHVYGYICSIVRSRDGAEDLMVETMTTVWQDAHRFAGQSRVLTWILGIARHKAIDAVRARARRPACVPIDVNSLEATAQSPPESAAAEQMV